MAEYGLKVHMIVCVSFAILMMFGCTLTKPMKWIVEPHSLDFVQMMYIPKVESDVKKRRKIRIELMGNGYVSYSEGSHNYSENTFWNQNVQPSWHDSIIDNTVIGEQSAKGFFQRVVDAGFFDQSFNEHHSQEEKRLLIYASINGQKNSKYTGKEELRDVFFDLLDIFR